MTEGVQGKPGEGFPAKQFRDDCGDLALKITMIANELARLANSDHPVFYRWGRANWALSALASLGQVVAQYYRTLRII